MIEDWTHTSLFVFCFYRLATAQQKTQTMAARVYIRTGAADAFGNLNTVKERTADLDANHYPYMAHASSHIASLLELDDATAMQAVVAIAPGMSARQDEYIESLVGAQDRDYCKHLLKSVTDMMTAEDKKRLHTEIAMAVGDVY